MESGSGIGAACGIDEGYQSSKCSSRVPEYSIENLTQHLHVSILETLSIYSCEAPHSIILDG
jgi:hypothetical protein